MIIRIEDRVSTSINFNFHTWYEVEIRLSDDPRQKEAIDGIIWLRRKKCVIYRLDIIFSIAHVAQLMVSKWTSFARELLVDIRRGISEEGYQTSKHVRKLKNDNDWLIICDTWPGCLEKLQFILTEPRQISNLRNQDVSKEILSDLVRKDIAEFSDKCSYFQYAILEMFKLALNNCSVLKLCFFNQHPHFYMYCKNVSHQYYATYQDTKPHILS